MTTQPNSAGLPPSLSDLLGQYLHEQTKAHERGLGFPDAGDEVVPYDAVPVQATDPRTAWEEALTALRLLGGVGSVGKVAPPPEWTSVLAAQEPATGLAFAAGNFPQLVRDLGRLMQGEGQAPPRPPAGRPVEAAALVEWATAQARTGRFPEVLLAVGLLRLARQYDRAAELLREHRANVPEAWQAACANEEAALAWHQGRFEEAEASWQAQPESAPVWFNRGVAALFAGRAAEARAALNRAVALLPEADAWHHLGRLYLALAEMRD